MKETKICSRKGCAHNGKPQPISNFNKNKRNKDGLADTCKDCRKKYRKDNFEKIQIRDKKKYEARRSRILIQKREYQQSPAKYDTYFEKLSPFDPCRRDLNNPKLLQVRCKYDGRWFNPTTLAVKHRVEAINRGFPPKRGEANLYCSEACKNACPTYGQILYPKGFKEPGSSREVQPELRKIVLERDNWTCQKCRKSKDDDPELELHCHHILPLNEDPIGSADIDNCITYCKECHQGVHMNVSGCGYAELRCSK